MPKNQYHAAPAMLRVGIERCPNGLSDGGAHRNAVWRLAHHTLDFTHTYLGPGVAAFRPR